MSYYTHHGKRAVDLAMALTAATVSLPIQLLIAVAVRIRLGRPVLFRQERPGRNGQPFVLVKFRTMTDQRDDAGALLPDAERLTPFGAFLRSTSLDELPEIWNVVRGDMSLVGPRPLLGKYMPLYSSEQARRHLVRPGITGWAQINGRNSRDWADRLAMDTWYVDHMSFRLDAAILLRTMRVVFSREGVSAEGHATMPAFEGDPGVPIHGAVTEENARGRD